MSLWPFDFRRPTPAPQPDPVVVAAENAIALFADAVERRDTRAQHDAERKAVRATALRLAAELRQAVGGKR